jgi:hypothetical protein
MSEQYGWHSRWIDSVLCRAKSDPERKEPMITHNWIDASSELADIEIAKTYFTCTRCNVGFLTDTNGASPPTDEYMLMASSGTVGACPRANCS